MRCFFYLIIVFFVCLETSCSQDTKRIDKSQEINIIWKKIPASWIEKVRRFNYGKNDTTLLKEFADFIKPDTLFNPHAMHVDPYYGPVFNVMFADLDGDGNDELICLQGWDIVSPYLCVLKEIKGNWYLIYKEVIDTFYNAPTIYVASCFSQNKTFYLRRVYDHGSGVYIDGYSFYKLINNRVYKCLDLINDAHIYGWGLFMNQSVKMNFEFSGDSDDDVSVNYSYNFFPGSIYKSDCPWCAHDDIQLINGEDNVDYVFDKKQHLYKLDIPSYKNKPEDLTGKKIACFGAFGNDSLFVNAFHDQIDEKFKSGTPLQKKILRGYLAALKKAKTATTEELEKKKQIGGTAFYGPKNEK